MVLAGWPAGEIAGCKTSTLDRQSISERIDRQYKDNTQSWNYKSILLHSDYDTTAI